MYTDKHLGDGMAEAADMLQQAIARHQAGDVRGAEVLYRQLLLEHPELSDAWHLLGVCDIQQGNLQSAVERILRAIRLAPQQSMFYANLGVAYQQQQRWTEAGQAYQQALTLRPDYAEAYHNLGIVWWHLKEFSRAIAAFEQAIRLAPKYLDAYLNLGGVMFEGGDWSQAVDCFRRAAELAPHNPDVFTNLGNALQEGGSIGEAEQAYRRAIELDPRAAIAYRNLGLLWRRMGRIEEALKATRQAILAGIADTETLALQMHLMLQQHCWDNIDDTGRQLLVSLEQSLADPQAKSVSPLAVLVLPSPVPSDLQQACARRWSQQFCLGHQEAAESSLGITGWCSTADYRLQRHVETRRLRVGYLSADFRVHPVGHLLPELIERHDREHFEVFGYSIGPDDQSEVRRRLVTAFDHFADLERCPHRQAATRIQQDRIDILVDLQGHTEGARTQILAYRPAPIQVNYLGFPGTMGADFIDFIIADPYVLPPAKADDFDEQIVYLTPCYLFNDRYRLEQARHLAEETSRDIARAKLGWAEDDFIFCGFSSPQKITPSIFGLWLRLLAEVPRSRLWLRESGERAKENLRRYAAERGIETDRLIFAPQVSMSEHLVRQTWADLFLDTFPYNQHSTASDALGVGVPLVTYSGEHFASRVAGSLLTALDCPELIAHSYDEYFEKALRFAMHPEKLCGVRAKLRLAMGTNELWSGSAQASKLETAYLRMYGMYRDQGLSRRE